MFQAGDSICGGPESGRNRGTVRGQAPWLPTVGRGRLPGSHRWDTFCALSCTKHVPQIHYLTLGASLRKGRHMLILQLSFSEAQGG